MVVLSLVLTWLACQTIVPILEQTTRGTVYCMYTV